MSVGTSTSGAPLPGWAIPQQASHALDFVADRREAAIAALEARGMPTKKTEAFRFTPVRELIETPFEPADVSADADAAAVLRRLGHDDTYRIIVSDGRPELHGSTRDGVSVVGLEEALETHRADLERTLGRLLPSEHFVASNTASFSDAAVVIVPEGTDASVPIHIAHVVTASDAAVVTHPRVLVLAGARSRVTVVESYLGDAAGRSLCNSVVEICAMDGATVDHVVSLEATSPVTVSVGVSVGARATYRARALLTSGKPARLDHRVSMDGEHGHADVGSVLFARGRELVDHHVLVDHRAPRTTSRTRSRGIADEAGTSVFDGIVVVRPTAPGCEVVQESKNLLLTSEASIHAKPHLEIEIDEVVASHGTTVGSFDRDQLFYLRSRGIDEGVARAMLTHAFVRTVLDDVSVPAVKARLERSLLARLPQGEAALTEESP